MLVVHLNNSFPHYVKSFSHQQGKLVLDIDAPDGFAGYLQILTDVTSVLRHYDLTQPQRLSSFQQPVLDPPYSPLVLNRSPDILERSDTCVIKVEFQLSETKTLRFDVKVEVDKSFAFLVRHIFRKHIFPEISQGRTAKTDRGFFSKWAFHRDGPLVSIRNMVNGQTYHMIKLRDDGKELLDGLTWSEKSKRKSVHIKFMKEEG